MMMDINTVLLCSSHIFLCDNLLHTHTHTHIYTHSEVLIHTTLALSEQTWDYQHVFTHSESGNSHNSHTNSLFNRMVHSASHQRYSFVDENRKYLYTNLNVQTNWSRNGQYGWQLSLSVSEHIDLVK